MGGGTLFSVRMRSARGGPHEKGGEHLSGGERLVERRLLPSAVHRLLLRGLRGGEADFLQITVEAISLEKVASGTSLPVTIVPEGDLEENRKAALRLLNLVGVSVKALERAFELLERGAAPGGGKIRGAAVLDPATGERLDPDPRRGFRVSHLDFNPGVRRRLERLMRAVGITGFRFPEALAIATKSTWAGTRAEVCWSDDPDYEAGYVASPLFGYVRLDPFKPRGFPRGGRVFFFPSSLPLEEYRQKLEEAPFLIEGLGEIRVMSRKTLLWELEQKLASPPATRPHPAGDLR